VQGLADVAHGALDYGELERLGISPEQVIDFSTNTNPYGPSPRVWEALRATPIERYPDRQALALRRALSRRLDWPVDGLLTGNGSAELLWLIALAYLEPGGRALVAGPTFGEYARAAGLTGATVDELRARPEHGFRLDPACMTAQLARHDYRLAFVCNPNNPTGQVLAVETLLGWAQAFPHTLFVIDEAYLAFANMAQAVVPPGAPNLLALRSMTKDYALTGLRLGYAAAHPEVISALRRVQPPWSVNAMAQAAGVAALEDDEHLRATQTQLHAAKEALITALIQRGFAPLPSAVQYFLVHVGHAARFRAALLPYGVQVRDCASFGLPEYVRIAARTPAENARLLEAIDKAIA
jgi:L-threonine-O-3-phosphate decarboxylase